MFDKPNENTDNNLENQSSTNNVPEQCFSQNLNETPDSSSIVSSESKITTEKDNKLKNGMKEIVDWIKVIITALIISFLLNHYVIVTAQVPTGSMENTVMTSDRIVAFRLSYLFEAPKRGDIIIFPFPDDESVNYLKRIIGLPGETVEIIDGKVYINNSKEPLKEDYLKETPTGSYGPFQVPADSYFMMGDNRNNSEDSRFWNHKFVKKEKIIGKAFLKYFPSVSLLK